MPVSTRAKSLTLITIRLGEVEIPVYGVSAFSKAYEISKAEIGMANPNLTEVQARKKLRSDNVVYLWDKDVYEHFEEALWSMTGKMVKLQTIKLKNKG